MGKFFGILILTYALALLLAWPIAGLVNTVIGYELVSTIQVFLTIVAARLFITAVR